MARVDAMIEEKLTPEEIAAFQSVTARLDAAIARFCQGLRATLTTDAIGISSQQKARTAHTEHAPHTHSRLTHCTRTGDDGGPGAFVKLSTRSPKDAATTSPVLCDRVQAAIEASTIGAL